MLSSLFPAQNWVFTTFSSILRPNHTVVRNPYRIPPPHPPKNDSFPPLPPNTPTILIIFFVWFFPFLHHILLFWFPFIFPLSSFSIIFSQFLSSPCGYFSPSKWHRPSTFPTQINILWPLLLSVILFTSYTWIKLSLTSCHPTLPSSTAYCIGHQVNNWPVMWTVSTENWLSSKLLGKQS